MERAVDYEHFVQAATRGSRGGCLCATGWALAIGLAALFVLFFAATREPGGFMPSCTARLHMNNSSGAKVWVSAASMSTWGGDMSTTRVHPLEPAEQADPRITWGESSAEFNPRRILITVIDDTSDDRASLLVTAEQLFTEGVRITRTKTGLVIAMVPRP